MRVILLGLEGLVRPLSLLVFILFAALRTRLVPAGAVQILFPAIGAVWALSVTIAAYRHGTIAGRPWPLPAHDAWTLALGGAVTALLLGITLRALIARIAPTPHR